MDRHSQCRSRWENVSIAVGAKSAGIDRMRFVVVMGVALAAAGCGGRANQPTVDGTPSRSIVDSGNGDAIGDAWTTVDGGECGPPSQLCDICGTLACHVGPCPMNECVTGTPTPDDAGTDLTKPPSCTLGAACSLGEACVGGVSDCGSNCQCLDGIWQTPCPASLPETGASCGVEGAECGYETDTNPCGADNCDCQGGTWNCGPTCAIELDAGEAGDASDAGPCQAGQRLCLEGCYSYRPVCVDGPCPVPPPCAYEPDAATCPSGQVMCQPCSYGSPSCVDLGDCLPAESCPPPSGMPPL
jgi:hypothetical protein